MDLSNPLSVITPTLDGPVLMALAATTGSSTGAHVHRMAGVGSADGVRRVLARLVGQGIVLADEHAHATLYRLNREHVAVPWLLGLSRVRGQVLELITANIAGWSLQPLHASLFGSFARAEADAASDIDILLVAEITPSEDDAWTVQLDTLGRDVRRSTGNDAHIVDVAPATLATMMNGDDPLIRSWRADAILLTGESVVTLLRRLQAGASPDLVTRA